ncbi:MAG TPA: hypothetical protein VF622_02405 [Segetibacter sp.]|jgi:hypothetical protein
MTLEAFKDLADSSKARELFTYGINISRRTLKRRMFFLYHLHSFYVEVVFNHLENKIERLKPFGETKLLDPYIKQIDLSPLGF